MSDGADLLWEEAEKRKSDELWQRLREDRQQRARNAHELADQILSALEVPPGKERDDEAVTIAQVLERNAALGPVS